MQYALFYYYVFQEICIKHLDLSNFQFGNFFQVFESVFQAMLQQNGFETETQNPYFLFCTGNLITWECVTNFTRIIIFLKDICHAGYLSRNQDIFVYFQLKSKQFSAVNLKMDNQQTTVEYLKQLFEVVRINLLEI
eukprot:TRINITY_DN358_c0_g3_i1.p1 TRINITY_DN358_c0_g3~~TRINITY_DN358_c0_g3_i1.p1  ORF type:complete len:136 (-),score=4.93 TRINITY_DN358_c0_g3_i1:335-742(-)